jgi:hypothetical protein
MTGYVLDLSGLKPVVSEPYPFTQLQLDWLNALEGDKFAQGQGSLCSGDNKYCCLGVMAELSGATKRLSPIRNAYRFTLADETSLSGGIGMLSYGLRKLALLKSDLGEFGQPVKFTGLLYANAEMAPGIEQGGHTSLASMNDVRMLPRSEGGWRAFTFKEIAAYIRHDPWNVFNPPEALVQAAFDNTPPWVEGAEYAEA